MITKEYAHNSVIYKITGTEKVHNPHRPAYVSDNLCCYVLNHKWHNIVGPSRIEGNNCTYSINDLEISNDN